MIFSIHTTCASCKGYFWGNRGHATPFILSSCGLAVLGGGHGILVAEEAVEGAAVGDAALLAIYGEYSSLLQRKNVCKITNYYQIDRMF